MECFINRIEAKVALKDRIGRHNRFIPYSGWICMIEEQLSTGLKYLKIKANKSIVD